jgi:hypothetical protein
MKKIAQLCMLAMFTALAALADPLIDFSGGYGGTISSGGLGTAVTGLNIAISQLLALDVPLNAVQPMAVTGPSGTGLLNFTTGTLTSVTSDANGVYTYKYGGGGTFNITGNVVGAGITTNPELLSGSFFDGSFTVQNIRSMSMVTFTAAGVDSKNAALLSYFGVPGTTQFTFAGFSIGANFFGNVGSNGAFSATAFSTDLANTATPEPSAILITGTCLLFVGGQFRKRLLGKRSSTKDSSTKIA